MDEFIFGDEIPTNEYILLTMVKYGLKLCEITTQSQFLIDKLFICVHMFSIVFQFFFPFWFHMFPLGISRFPLGHPIFFHSRGATEVASAGPDLPGGSGECTHLDASPGRGPQEPYIWVNLITTSLFSLTTNNKKFINNIAGWWYTYPSEKDERQLVVLFL
jgi:hypothetical protein